MMKTTQQVSPCLWARWKGGHLALRGWRHFSSVFWLWMMALCQLTLAPQVDAAVGDTFTDSCFTYKILMEEGTTGAVSVRGQTVHLPSGEVSIPSTVTQGEITYSVTRIEDSAFSYCTSLTSVVIPDGVTSIGEGAFKSCYSLASLTIPASVTSIGSLAFSGCLRMEQVEVEPDNKNYSSREGVLFNKDQTTLIQYPIAKKGDSYTLAQGVTTIGESAFYDCRKLVRIVIPEGVTTIGKEAFLCCDALRSVTLPETVTSLGAGSFAQCSRLSAIYFKGNAPETGDHVIDFSPCDIYYVEGTTGWTYLWAGRRTATWVPGPEVAPEPVVDPETGVVIGFILTYPQGSILEESLDLKSWTPVKEGATPGSYIVRTQGGGPQKFYRSVRTQEGM